VPLAEIPLQSTGWLILVLLGGILALDAVSWPQVMVSRPLVSATVGGWLLGDPASGFIVGALLELMSLRHPPYGAARYPDAGPAGLVAGAAYAAAGGASLGALVAAILAGWGVGWIGAFTVQMRRRGNERLMADEAALAARPESLERRHRLALRLDAVRGALLTAGFVAPAVLAAAWSVGQPASAAATAWGAAMLVTALAASAGAGGRTSSRGVRGWPLLLAGAVAGALLVAVVA
jgi:mannose/fructose/N-acetylgalactosamine-specific phosphotransferase system component IIC